MNKLILIPLALLLQGCMYQVTSANDLAKANQFCEDKRGVYSITVAFTSAEKVECENRETTMLRRIILKPE